MAAPPSPGGSHTPPAEPHRALRRADTGEFSALEAGLERPARIQMAIAVVLGLVLVAIPLYLWRRPRSVSETVGDATRAQANADGLASATAAGAADAGAGAGAAATAAGTGAADTGSPTAALSLADARVLECHDQGSKRTAPSECDHLPGIEKAMASAIVGAVTCVPASAGGGTIEYVADVSFLRKHNPIAVTAPRDGRTIKNVKVAVACAKAVKEGMIGTPLDMPHQHGRYKIAVLATYAGGTPQPQGR